MTRRQGMLPGGAGFAVALLLCALCGATVPAAAQGLNPGAASDSRPIEIQADSGIEWQQGAQVYIARGNAVATRGATEIHADTLIAHYRPTKGASEGGATEIYRIDAEGNVVIKDPTRTVVGDHAVWDVDQAVGVVTGNALKMTTAIDVVTARDSLEWYDQKQIGVARGDAVAIRRDKTIKADILTAYMVKNDAKPGAGGAATQPGQPAKPPATKAAANAAAKPPGAHGDYAVYNADTGICTLIGNAVIIRGKDVVRGQYAVMDLNNNVNRMLPASGVPGIPPERVQGLFVKQDQAPGTSGSGAGKDGSPAADGKSQ